MGPLRKLEISRSFESYMSWDDCRKVWLWSTTNYGFWGCVENLGSQLVTQICEKEHIISMLWLHIYYLKIHYSKFQHNLDYPLTLENAAEFTRIPKN
jgi:hypothetical protein